MKSVKAQVAAKAAAEENKKNAKENRNDEPKRNCSQSI